jgi:hypothetical protein
MSVESKEDGMSRQWMKMLAASGVIALGVTTASAVNVDKTVDSGATWVGYMNVRDLPADGGAFMFGSGWGVADLDAGFAGPNAWVSPNTNIARNVPLTDTFWWKPDGSPNKEMEANYFVELNTLAQFDVLNFSGIVLSNNLVAPYTSNAFIKVLDPSNSFALVDFIQTPLVPGPFSISQVINLPGTIVQYGFVTVGPQSTIGSPTASQAQLGLAVIGPIPEPATLGLLGLAVPALARRRRA